MHAVCIEPKLLECVIAGFLACPARAMTSSQRGYLVEKKQLRILTRRHNLPVAPFVLQHAGDPGLPGPSLCDMAR